MAERRRTPPPSPGTKPPGAEERVLRHMCGSGVPLLSATLAEQLGYTEGNLRSILARLSRDGRVSYERVDGGKRALWKATEHGRNRLIQLDAERAAASDSISVEQGLALLARRR